MKGLYFGLVLLLFGLPFCGLGQTEEPVDYFGAHSVFRKHWMVCRSVPGNPKRIKRQEDSARRYLSIPGNWYVDSASGTRLQPDSMGMTLFLSDSSEWFSFRFPGIESYTELLCDLSWHADSTLDTLVLQLALVDTNQQSSNRRDWEIRIPKKSEFNWGPFQFSIPEAVTDWMKEDENKPGFRRQIRWLSGHWVGKKPRSVRFSRFSVSTGRGHH